MLRPQDICPCCFSTRSSLLYSLGLLPLLSYLQSSTASYMLQNDILANGRAHVMLCAPWSLWLWYLGSCQYTLWCNGKTFLWIHRSTLLYPVLVAYTQLRNLNFIYCMCMWVGAFVHGMLVEARGPFEGAHFPLPPVLVIELRLSGWAAASSFTYWAILLALDVLFVSFFFSLSCLELSIPLPQFPKCWDYRSTLPHPAILDFFQL